MAVPILEKTDVQVVGVPEGGGPVDREKDETRHDITQLSPCADYICLRELTFCCLSILPPFKDIQDGWLNYLKRICLIDAQSVSALLQTDNSGRQDFAFRAYNLVTIVKVNCENRFNGTISEEEALKILKNFQVMLERCKKYDYNRLRSYGYQPLGKAARLKNLKEHLKIVIDQSTQATKQINFKTAFDL